MHSREEKGLKGKYKQFKQKFSFLKWIDPFTYVEILLRKFHPKKEKPSAFDETIDWAVYLFFAAVFAFLIYTAFGIILNTPAPMVIVMSGSMEPVMYRGDVIVLYGATKEEIKAPEISLPRDTLEETLLIEFAKPAYNRKNISSIDFENGEKIEISTEGDIVVYHSKLKDEPIIHRAVAKLKVIDGTYFLTKGDSVLNTTIDQDCGRIIPPGIPEKDCITLYPVPYEEIQGKAVLKIPLAGCVKLWLFDDLTSLIVNGRLPSDFRGIC